MKYQLGYSLHDNSKKLVSITVDHHPSGSVKYDTSMGSPTWVRLAVSVYAKRTAWWTAHVVVRVWIQVHCLRSQFAMRVSRSNSVTASW